MNRERINKALETAHEALSYAALSATNSKDAEYYKDAEKEVFAALSAPKAEAVEPTHWAVYSKTGVHIGLWRSKMVAEQAAEDYPEAIIIPLYTSPVPALTDEAVERFVKFLHENMHKDHDTYQGAWVSADANDRWKETGILTIDGEVDIFAALLAAFPSKGE